MKNQIIKCKVRAIALIFFKIIDKKTWWWVYFMYDRVKGDVYVKNE